MTELVTAKQIALMEGISEASGRRLVQQLKLEAVGRDTVTGAKLYDANQARAALNNSDLRPGRGRRTDLKEKTVTTTTQLHGFAHYARVASPEDSVRDYLGEFEGDYDVDGLTNAYREAINDALDGTGISLIGSDFYSGYPAPGDATDLIEGALAAVDLGALAADYDTTLEEQ